MSTSIYPVFDPTQFAAAGVATIPPAGPAGIVPPGSAVLVPGQRVNPTPAQQAQGINYGVVQNDLSVMWYGAGGGSIIPGLHTNFLLASFQPAMSKTVNFSTPGYSAAALPIGAPWTLTLGNLPQNAEVNVSGTIAGVSFTPYLLGASDQQGNLTLSGQIGGPAGAYHEDYTLVQDGSLIGSIDYTVVDTAQPASGLPASYTTQTQTVTTAIATPKRASNQTQPTTIVTTPADPRNIAAGYGTIPLGAGGPKLLFQLSPNVPLSAVPPGTAFSANITGAPAGQNIIVSISVGGATYSTIDLGPAGADGTLQLSGVIPSGPGGAWHEEYSVSGNPPFAALDFVISGPGGSSPAMGGNWTWLLIIAIGAYLLFRK